MLQSSKLGLLNKLYKIHHAEFWHLTRHWGNPRCCSIQVGQGSAQFSQHLAAPYLYRDDGLILTLFKDVKTCVDFGTAILMTRTISCHMDVSYRLVKHCGKATT